MDLKLQDKVVIVTGGASGIGEATVLALAEEGAIPVVADRDAKGAERVSRAIHDVGGKAMPCAVELTNESDITALVENVVKKFGRIDGVVNNAGVNDQVDLSRGPEEFLASIHKNLVHVYSLVHYAVDELRKSKGCVVNVASKVAMTGQGNTSGYAAAKGGVLGLTREWAVALAGDGIRVNTVVPAEVKTALYDRWIESQEDPKAALADVQALIPLGNRLTTPEEIADAIVFLASPRSSHTTGQIVFVDGGYTHLDRRLRG